MICPKCREDTLADFGMMEGVEIDFCSGCKGIWFDAGELAFYVEVEADVPGMAKALASGKPAGCNCPSCSTELVEAHYVSGEPLLIDICPSCKGVFLDSGELPQVESLAARYGGAKKILNTVKALEKKGYMILGSG
jgi:Zn-finger nucleic acid-binding protein